MKAISSLKPKRLRVNWEAEDLTRLLSMLAVIKPEFANYQAEAAHHDLVAHSEATENILQMIAGLEILLTRLPELIERSRAEEKQGRARVWLSEEEVTELRLINFCAQRLPEGAICWREFSRALAPLITALDQGIFDHFIAGNLPKAVSCSIDDLKRGRDRAEQITTAASTTADTEPTEIDGFDWNV